MKFLLINISTLFLLINFKFGDTIRCFQEEDINLPGESSSKIKLTKCGKMFGDECFKVDCGEYGFFKSCGGCAVMDLGMLALGMDKHCTCYECDTDYCNSSIGIRSNLGIIILFCLIIMMINFM
uniref:Uncharacterized protein n=1 Tax=Meloidogyne incognita TaxID=6306 RepID=A0A914L2H1_MELIC